MSAQADHPATGGILPSLAANHEKQAYADLRRLLAESPVPERERLDNLGLYLNRPALGRILQMHSLYQRILDKPGVIMEFGVRYGQNMALFTTLRNIYEPHNYGRRVIGFDTFEGLAGVGESDGIAPAARDGTYNVAPGHESHLASVLAAHEQLSPRPHLRRFEIVKGDVRETLRTYLDRHPETIVALAYFDLDIYEPTRACLEMLRPHLYNGSVLGFDEIGLPEFPGETRAVHEVLGLGNLELRRDPTCLYQSYAVWQGAGRT
jgi:Macrocin-O-methyltransferase (TylF)